MLRFFLSFLCYLIFSCLIIRHMFAMMIPNLFLISYAQHFTCFILPYVLHFPCFILTYAICLPFIFHAVIAWLFTIYTREQLRCSTASLCQNPICFLLDSLKPIKTIPTLVGTLVGSSIQNQATLELQSVDNLFGCLKT